MTSFNWSLSRLSRPLISCYLLLSLFYIFINCKRLFIYASPVFFGGLLFLTYKGDLSLVISPLSKHEGGSNYLQVSLSMSSFWKIYSFSSWSSALAPPPFLLEIGVTYKLDGLLLLCPLRRLLLFFPFPSPSRFVAYFFFF